MLLELETNKAQSIQTKQQLPCAYHGIDVFKDFFVKITHLFSHHCLQALFLLLKRVTSETIKYLILCQEQRRCWLEPNYQYFTSV